ncbi:hypothetical protein R3P38DRAFT_2813666 [Favolaschia claudopus]|uniref:Uncharacterized protein n=1 Tax=Favolaschia claudopus TaxID=2862362 RepID=A0AAV9Z3E1_9AGAR
MPSNDVSAPPQHTYAANAARLSCLLPPPPRLDIVAVSTSPSPLNDPHASRTRPAPLLPLPAVHTTSATRVRMAKLATKDPALASSQHRDSAGFPSDERQRIQGLAQRRS